jgi:hypothetical protein
MTDDDDDKDYWDPESAVDLLELHLLGFFDDENPDRETIIFPRDAARIILELAKKALHKGRGRRGVPLSEVDKMRQECLVEWARDRKAELQADDPNISAVQATLQAAAEAKQLCDHYGMKRALKAVTIKRLMESNK